MSDKGFVYMTPWVPLEELDTDVDAAFALQDPWAFNRVTLIRYQFVKDMINRGPHA